MLSLSLDTGLESFSPLARALVSWKSAQTLTTHGFSSGCILASCIRAAAWCCCCHGNCAVGTQPISSFSNAVNRQLCADAFSEEIIHSGPILMQLYQPVLGVWFFETQHRSRSYAPVAMITAMKMTATTATKYQIIQCLSVQKPCCAPLPLVSKVSPVSPLHSSKPRTPTNQQMYPTIVPLWLHAGLPLTSIWHLSGNDCLEDKSEDYRKCSLL